MFVDDIILTNDIRGNSMLIKTDTTDGNDSTRIQIAGGGAAGGTRGALITINGNERAGAGGDISFSLGNAGGEEYQFFNGSGSLILKINAATLFPNTDSAFDLGDATHFWDETFTDELILTNVGAAAAAADKVVISAIDLSAGNTILDINTEGTGVEGSGTPTADKTIAIRVNGNVRYLLASTVAA